MATEKKRVSELEHFRKDIPLCEGKNVKRKKKEKKNKKGKGRQTCQLKGFKGKWDPTERRRGGPFLEAILLLHFGEG